MAVTPRRKMQAAEAKRKFRALLDAAERGDETVIFRHGKPVAIVRPFEPGSERTGASPIAVSTGPGPAAAEFGVRRPTRPGGLLAAVTIMQGWDSMQDDVEAVMREGATDSTRQLPDETFE